MTPGQSKKAEIAAAEEARERDELIMASKYASLFKSALGQEVLDDLKSRSGLFRRVFSPETAYDPVRSACIDGARGVVIHILTNIEKANNAKK